MAKSNEPFSYIALLVDETKDFLDRFQKSTIADHKTAARLATLNSNSKKLKESVKYGITATDIEWFRFVNDDSLRCFWPPRRTAAVHNDFQNDYVVLLRRALNETLDADVSNTVWKPIVTLKLEFDGFISNVIIPNMQSETSEILKDLFNGYSSNIRSLCDQIADDIPSNDKRRTNEDFPFLINFSFFNEHPLDRGGCRTFLDFVLGMLKHYVKRILNGIDETAVHEQHLRDPKIKEAIWRLKIYSDSPTEVRTIQKLLVGLETPADVERDLSDIVSNIDKLSKCVKKSMNRGIPEYGEPAAVPKKEKWQLESTMAAVEIRCQCQKLGIKISRPQLASDLAQLFPNDSIPTGNGNALHSRCLKLCKNDKNFSFTGPGRRKIPKLAAYPNCVKKILQNYGAVNIELISFSNS